MLTLNLEKVEKKYAKSFDAGLIIYTCPKFKASLANMYLEEIKTWIIATFIVEFPLFQ